jgi:hypothetical protein
MGRRVQRSLWHYFVDYSTQKRTPKDSAFWLRDVAAANGLKPLAEGWPA